MEIGVERHPESADAKWILVTVHLELSRVSLEEEMDHFLQSVLIPMVHDLRPDIMVGDVMAFSQYLPSVPELERGTPSEVCWLNVYGSSVVKAIGYDRIRALDDVPTVRVNSIGEDLTLILLEPLPKPDPRAFIRSVLNLAPTEKEGGIGT